MHKNKKFFNAALSLGATGYVLKDSAITDLINAVNAVSTGQNFISPQLSTFLITRSRQTESARLCLEGKSLLIERNLTFSPVG